MISFKTALHETETPALLDSGATENFISPTLATSLGLVPRKLRKAIDIHTVDGSTHKDGKLDSYLWLKVDLAGRKTLLMFLVTPIGDDHLILGYPFLHRFNPQIDWRRAKILDGRVTISSMKELPSPSPAQANLRVQREAIKQCGKPGENEAIYIRSMQGLQVTPLKPGQLGDIPAEYQCHWRVFSEEESHRFPPKRSEDMRITLKPGAPDHIDCKVYPQSKADRERMKEWLKKEEDLKRVAQEQSNYVSPVYFIDKIQEDGTPSPDKRLIMNYKALNEHTIKDHNPLPNIQEAIERLHGKTLFSKFDIRWGYNNIRLHPDDRHRAA